MLRIPLVTLCFAGAVTVVASQDPQAPGVFRVSGETVPVYVTVTERDRLVTTLTRDQFTVRDNGRVQPLTVFDNSPQPIRLIVLVDVSGSMYGNLPLLREAGAELFSQLGPDDLATVGTFGKQISIDPTFRRSTASLVDALPRAIDPNAPTPLWRAVDQAMDLFKDLPGRRVILVASDGKNSPIGSWGQKPVGHFEIIDRASRENVMIYAVAMQSRLPPGGQPLIGAGNIRQAMVDAFPDPGFGTAAMATGGGYVEIRPRSDLAGVLRGIVAELHSQYLLGFAPPLADGKRHDIEVRVNQRDVKVRARESYLAPKGR